MPEYKRVAAPIAFKADEEGRFTATFATLNVIDHDGDVTIPGAFQDGQAVRVAQWGHNWGALPAGKGVIHADEQKAWIDGEFFLDTTHGLDTFRTVKRLGDLQEWSYGYDPLEYSFGEFEGDHVRFLRRLDTIEVSPVMLGAGLDTGTDSIKGAFGLDDDGALMVARARAYLGRAKARAEMRGKEGRTLSGANRELIGRDVAALRDVIGDLEGLLTATEPPKADTDMAEAKALIEGALRDSFRVVLAAAH